MHELGKLFIIIGLIFDFYAVISLLRMPDVYARLQASAKNVTLGTCSIMFGVFLHNLGLSAGFKALLVIGFFILICPVAVHVLARGAHKCGIRLTDEAVCDRYRDDYKRPRSKSVKSPKQRKKPR